MNFHWIGKLPEYDMLYEYSVTPALHKTVYIKPWPIYLADVPSQACVLLQARFISLNK